MGKEVSQILQGFYKMAMDFWYLMEQCTVYIVYKLALVTFTYFW